jgi:hypothetical protein
MLIARENAAEGIEICIKRHVKFQTKKRQAQP